MYYCGMPKGTCWNDIITVKLLYTRSFSHYACWKASGSYSVAKSVFKISKIHIATYQSIFGHPEDTFGFDSMYVPNQYCQDAIKVL